MKTMNCFNNPCATPPSVMVVQSIEGIKGLTNCIVSVISNNTVYYVSPCHEITIISSGPVFVDSYDVVNNPLGLRGQVCYDFAAGFEIIYNNAGDYRVVPLEKVEIAE